MAPRLRMVYDQMPEPKYVIAMGACAITGGLYFDSYNVLPGVDGVIAADVYVLGCPPRPETLILQIREKIKETKKVGVKNLSPQEAGITVRSGHHILQIRNLQAHTS